MIKKGSSILFILVANIVLLAHLILPHHHHHEEVCFVNNHCQTDHDRQNHDDANHEHDTNNDFRNCALRQDIILPSNPDRQEIKSFDTPDNYSGYQTLQAVLLNSDLVKQILKNFYRPPAPRLFSSYTRFAIKCCGLRAPPIV